MGKTIKRKAKPGVRVTKAHYWCLQYLSNVMGIPISDMIVKYLRKVIQDINDGKLVNRMSKSLKNNKYYIQCNMPRELRIEAEIVKINQDLHGWEISDMVRIAIKRIIQDHTATYPEIEKIIRRYDESEKRKFGELQEKRETKPEVRE